VSLACSKHGDQSHDRRWDFQAQRRLLYLVSQELDAERRPHFAARREGVEEGIEKGIEKGKLAGTIQTLQQVVGDAIASDAELLARSTSELHAVIVKLQQRLRMRDV
jgi:hypothetical protein